MILVSGADKADAVARAFDDGVAVADCPVRGVRPAAGQPDVAPRCRRGIEAVGRPRPRHVDVTRAGVGCQPVWRPCQAAMSTGTEPDAPFRLDLGPAAGGPLRRAMLAMAQPALERLLALPALNDLYAGPWRSDVDAFSEQALERLRVSLDVAAADLARVPAAGPLVVVANHPFGGVDGPGPARAAARVRPDVKLLGNYLLHRVPELRDTVIPVDPFGGGDAIRGSVRGLKAAQRWVEAGGCLAVFPAGEVSHLQLGQGAILDPAWSPERRAPGAARRCVDAADPFRRRERRPVPARRAGASAPAHGDAAARAVAAPGDVVSVRVGRVVPAARIASMDDEAGTALLRARTYVLARDPRPLPTGDAATAIRSTAPVHAGGGRPGGGSPARRRGRGAAGVVLARRTG